MQPPTRASLAHDELVREALAASRESDTETAISLFRQAIEADPGVASTHLLLAAELAQAGHDAQAESSYAAALWLAPGLDIARFQLGLLQLCGRKATAALLTWQPLFALPDDAPLGNAARGIAALMSGNNDEAIARLRRAIDGCHDNPPLATDLQRICAALGAQAGDPDEGHLAGAHVLLSNYRPEGPGH